MNKFETNIRQDRMPSAHKQASYYGEANQEFAVTYTSIKSGIFNLYLFGEIDNSAQFINAVEAMNAATELDIVNIHLSSNGGSLDATDTFLAAMGRCEAKIKTFVSGGCHSAATIILLNSDEFSLSEHSNFLVHNGSAGAGGKYSDFKSQSKHVVSYMEKILRKTYKHFLTDVELDALIEGKDFWLDADEFGARYEIMNEAYKEEYENEQAALRVAEKPATSPKKKTH